MAFMFTRRNWKEPQPGPLTVLFPEVHAWFRSGAPIRTLWIYIGLAFFILVFYAPVLGHDFISLADYDYVRDNPHVATGLSLGNVFWAFRTGHTGIWQPLTWLSHMRDCQIFGLSPGWQHFNNVLLHALNALLLFFVFSWFTGERWRTAFVVALFAFHPLNVESVAWIAARKNLLATSFLLLGLLAYGYFLEQPGRHRQILLISIFTLGLMTSPIIVTFPFLLLLIDYWPLGRVQLGWKLRELLVEKIPLFAISVIASVVTLLVSKKAGDLSIFDAVPFPSRLANALLSCVRYLGRIFWPANLFLPYRYDQSYSALSLWIVGIALSAITGVVICFRRKPYLATGWFWYLGTLVPVLGLIQIGPESMADRYTYIASIGIFLGLTWACADLFSRWPVSQRALAWVGAALIIMCVVKTSFQLRSWENTETLLKHSLKLDPRNYLALEKLGDEFLRQKRFDEAFSCFEGVLPLAPNHPYARATLASILYSRGRGVEASENYEKALGIISPSLDRLRLSDRNKVAVVMNNFAWLRATMPDSKLRNAEESLRLAKQSVALTSPPSAVQLGTLAAAQAENGQSTTAVATARQALNLAQAQQQSDLAAMIQKSITAYEGGRSIRQLPRSAETAKNTPSASESSDIDLLSLPLWISQTQGAKPTPTPLPGVQEPKF